MKNTRKKLLVSSIAMLLVALFALSTATYAWFTTRTTLTADGINVKTAKAADLQIANDTTDYTSDDISYDVEDLILNPAHTDDEGANWVFAYSEDSTDADVDAETTAIDEDDLDGYVFADSLKIKNNGTETITGVEVSIQFDEENAGGQYARVALYDGATWTEVEAGDEATVIEIGSMAAAATKEYSLYVWFEGTDADCIDTNRGSEVPNVTIAVSCDTSSTAA